MASNQYYIDAMNDIRFNIECLMFFSDWKKRYRYTQLEKFWDKTIDLLKKEQKCLVAKFKEDWDEDVDIQIIKDELNGIAMRKDKAKIMIKQIIESGVELTDSEDDFLVSIYESMYSTLTQKQADWLKQIYRRVIL